MLGADTRRAATVLARERQKAEIRRERDEMLLAIARDLGPDGLARRLGADAEVTHALLDSARRRRADAESRTAVSEIRARRRRVPDSERWAEADRHFAALGRGAPGSLRRFAQPE